MDMNKPRHFIRNIIAADIKQKTVVVHTRFPPEPNGCLHIGHAKAICLNFGLAQDYPDGMCYLRFDDTNPAQEDVVYANAIIEDVAWLGFDCGKHLSYTSDYFPQLYDYAVQLIKLGKAYVDDLSAEQISAYRGTLSEAGKNSPYRERSAVENLDLFARMRQGEFESGACVLRAKIDMAAANINLRDPTIYRIKKEHHHRTGDKWCIYPMYDYAHCLSDAIEQINYSLCTLEFEDHRPLYDWFLHTLKIEPCPRQIEFARLNLGFTITSKRRLNQLINEQYVAGWDDPRMPTLSGMRRRGYSPKAIREFCDRIGISKKDSLIDMGVLEECVREDLNQHAPRAMAVLDPLKIVIENYPEDKQEIFEVPSHPNDPSMGMRSLPFSRELYIERNDFMLEPPKKFFRLAPEREVRLRYAYIIRCQQVITNNKGDIVELRCTYDPETKSGQGGRKVKGVIHWLSCSHALPTEVRLYDRLFKVAEPHPQNWVDDLNLEAMQVVHAYVEPSLSATQVGRQFQFERLGYFCVDSDQYNNHPVFNRIVTLRDTWARLNRC